MFKCGMLNDECSNADRSQTFWHSACAIWHVVLDACEVRARGGRRRGRRVDREVDQYLQFLAGLEVRHLLRRHVHLVARLWIAPLARLPATQPEAAEPAQLDLLAAVQRVDDALEHCVDDDFRMLLREVRNPRDFLDELRLRHAAGVHWGPLPTVGA